MATEDPTQDGEERAEPGASTSVEDAADADPRGRAQRLIEGAPAEQIAAAMDTRKHERAADLLERHGERLLLDGDSAQLLRWFRELPDDTVQQRPKLAILHAWLAVYTEHYQDALKRLGEAERGLSALEMGHRADGASQPLTALDQIADLRRNVRALRTHLAWMRGDLSNLPVSEDVALLAQSDDHPVWQAAALLILGRSRYLSGAVDDAVQDLEAALAVAEIARQGRARAVALEARLLLGRVAEVRGAFDVAERHYDAVMRQAAEAPAHPEMQVGAHVGLARLAYLRSDLRLAREHLGAIDRDVLAESNALIVALDCHVVEALTAQAGGNDGAAEAAIDRAEAFLSARERRWAMEVVNAYRARMALARGDLAAARRWAQQYAIRGGDRLGTIKEIQQIVFALVKLADAPDQAADVARVAREAAATGGRLLYAAEAAIIEALGLRAGGKAAEAKAAMDRALGWASRSCIARPFVARGPAILESLDDRDAAAGTSAEAALVDKIREQIGEMTGRGAATARPPDPIATKQPVPGPTPAKGGAATEERAADAGGGGAPKDAPASKGPKASTAAKDTSAASAKDPSKIAKGMPAPKGADDAVDDGEGRRGGDAGVGAAASKPGAPTG